MSVMQQDNRPLDTLSEYELTEVIEQEVSTLPLVDMRLRGNVDYVVTLLIEILRRRRLLAVDYELSNEDLDNKIGRYEMKYGMTSSELLQMEKEGKVPDKLEYHAWLSWLQAKGVRS